MSVYKAASSATSSVFTTVSTVAHQATRTVETVGAGLDMLNSFVHTAAAKQKARTAIDMANFYTQLVEDSALEESKRQKELINELKNDETVKKLYESNLVKLQTVIDNLINVEESE